MIVEIYPIEPENGEARYLVTQGCGCCSEHIDVDINNIDNAIKEHEAFIKQLKELRNTLV